MKKRISFALLSLALAGAMTARAEVIPFDLEVGYRWLNLKGNEDMYRTQINERDGFMIHSFNMTAPGNGSNLYDRIRIDVNELGTGPAGSFRLDATKADLYNLRLRYLQRNSYSALTEFANPFIGQGVIPGQHTYDRSRRMFDAELEFLPNGTLSPFVGFATNHLRGPGTTTYHLGQDEFLLRSSLNDKDNEFRVGSGFNFGSVYGQVTQGWRRGHTTDALTLMPGANGGNFPGPVLGVTQNAGQITRNDSNSVRTPFFNGFVTGQFKIVRLVGNYVRFDAKSTGSEDESASGTFASFGLGRFFNGLSETAISSAQNRTSRAGVRAEATVWSGVDVFAGYQKEHRELDGFGVLSTLYRQTTNFGGLDPRDIQTALSASSSMLRDEGYSNIGVSAKAFGPFSLRAEYRITKVDVSVAPDLAEIVVPGPSQGGDFERKVNTFNVNANYAAHGFLLSGAWRNDDADTPVFRTDYAKRNRYRLRGAWTSPKDYVRLGVVREQIDIDNNDPSIALDAKTRQLSADIEVNPIKYLSFRGAYGHFRSDSSMLYRLPQNFNTATSVFNERGKSKEGGFTFVFAPVSVDAGLARFENEGSNPFKFDRAHVRATIDLPAKTGIAAEFDSNKYLEGGRSFGNYDAKRYGVYLRYHP